MAVDHSQARDERGGERRGRGVAVGAEGEFGFEGTGEGVGGGVGAGGRGDSIGSRRGAQSTPGCGGHTMGGGVSMASRRGCKT